MLCHAAVFLCLWKKGNNLGLNFIAKSNVFISEDVLKLASRHKKLEQLGALCQQQDRHKSNFKLSFNLDILEFIVQVEVGPGFYLI